MQTSSAATSADVAYVILASPYATRLAKDGFIDAARVLETMFRSHIIGIGKSRSIPLFRNVYVL